MTKTRKEFNFKLQDSQQQVETLKKKWLTFSKKEEELAIEFLTHSSYLRLVGYFWPYRSKWSDGQHTFNTWVSFSTIYQSYKFDEKCRLLLFAYIWVIENSFKNKFNYLSITATNDTIRWTQEQYYKPWSKWYSEIVATIMREIETQTSKSEYIQMYTKRYYQPLYPPFWNMIEVFTLWQIIRIFNSLQDKNIKGQVAKKYGFNDHVFWGIMKWILDIRNACCHHNRLLFNNKITFPQTKHLQNAYNWQYSWLYAMCVTVRAMVKNIGMSDTFKSELIQLVETYYEVDNWFPENWSDLR